MAFRNVLSCIECMRCRLLLPMLSVSVCQSVRPSVSLSAPNDLAQCYCAGSFGAAFAKSLWPLVHSVIPDGPGRSSPDTKYRNVVVMRLVGPCSLEYSKMKMPDHCWSDPTASELIQRHRIHTSARQHGLLLRGGSPQRPALRVSYVCLYCCTVYLPQSGTCERGLGKKIGWQSLICQVATFAAFTTKDFHQKLWCFGRLANHSNWDKKTLTIHTLFTLRGGGVVPAAYLVFQYLCR